MTSSEKKKPAPNVPKPIPPKPVPPRSVVTEGIDSARKRGFTTDSDSTGQSR